jgi:hypothetical protein
MKSVNYTVKFEEKAGRLELFIRWLWAIPCAVVLVLLAILASIGWFFQALHILLLGKRHKMLHDWILMYYTYLIKFQSYLNLLTDERCPIMPES